MPASGSRGDQPCRDLRHRGHVELLDGDVALKFYPVSRSLWRLALPFRAGGRRETTLYG